jgi:hypothetical protein
MMAKARAGSLTEPTAQEKGWREVATIRQAFRTEVLGFMRSGGDRRHMALGLGEITGRGTWPGSDHKARAEKVKAFVEDLKGKLMAEDDPDGRGTLFVLMDRLSDEEVASLAMDLLSMFESLVEDGVE